MMSNFCFTVSEFEVICAILELPIETEHGNDKRKILRSRDYLLDKKLILNKNRKLMLSSSLESTLNVTIKPEVVYVLDIQTVKFDNPSDQENHKYIFSLIKDDLVLNWVDDTENYHFEHYPASKISSILWKVITGELLQHQFKKSAMDAAILQQTSPKPIQTMLLMKVVTPQDVTPLTSALAWYISNDALWLMHNQQEPQPVQADQLLEKVKQFSHGT